MMWFFSGSDLAVIEECGLAEVIEEAGAACANLSSVNPFCDSW